MKEIGLEIVNGAPWSSHRIILPFLKWPFNLKSIKFAVISLTAASSETLKLRVDAVTVNYYQRSC